MMTLGWVQTVLATKPVDKEFYQKAHPDWKCIYDSTDDPAFGKKPLMQLWVCSRDLKESFEEEAHETFTDGENSFVLQIVRMGDYPKIEFDAANTAHQ